MLTPVTETGKGCHTVRVRRAEKKHHWQMLGYTLLHVTPLGLSFALSVWTLVIIALFLCGNHCVYLYLHLCLESSVRRERKYAVMMPSRKYEYKPSAFGIG
jgi:hypothetical protein